MHKEQVFQAILLLFIVLSGIMSLFNLEAAGIITLGNFNSYNGGVLPGEINIVAPASYTTTGSLIQQDDFTSSTGWNASSISVYGVAALYSNPWTQENGIGYVLTANTVYGTIPGDFGVIGVQQNTNGIYDVMYNINDSVNSPF